MLVDSDINGTSYYQLVTLTSVCLTQRTVCYYQLVIFIFVKIHGEIQFYWLPMDILFLLRSLGIFFLSPTYHAMVTSI